jgi:intracellular multiplication protein IcmP
MAQQQGGSNQDNSMSALWITAAVVIAAIAIWYNWHSYIVRFFLDIKIFELTIVSLFSNRVDTLIQTLQHANPATITFPVLSDICALAGGYFAYPLVALCSIFALVLFKSNVGTEYTKQHSIESLVQQEKNNWPQIAPLEKLSLLKMPLDAAPWGMALQPMQFAKINKLLRFEKHIHIPGRYRSNSPVAVSVLPGPATALFVKQLGRFWRGPEHLPIYAQALFAAFAARINHDLPAAEKLFNHIALSAAKGSPDFSGVAELLRKYGYTPVVLEACSHHAYEYTVLSTMLLLAREDGVQAVSDFLWLKPIDRPLWYMMNTTGRRTAFVEVAGPVAHWLAERDLGRRLYVPMVQEAVVALELSIKDSLLVPTEEELKELTENAQLDSGSEE